MMTPWLISSTNMWLCNAGLVEEAKLTFDDLFGENWEWQTRVIKSDVQDIIARIESRFLGVHRLY